MRKVDYLIIGQGIAGSLIAHFLESISKSFIILDESKENTSSKLAAGIINPITGRRFVKSWMFDELLPIARETYLEFEEKLQAKFLFDHSIKRALFSQKEENEWYSRSLDDTYAPYILDDCKQDDFIEKTLTPPFSWGEIIGSGRMEMPSLIQKYGIYLKSIGKLKSEAFNFSELVIEENGVIYQNIRAKKVIFCEGINAVNNPFFNHLPFVPSKGDVLFIKIADKGFDKIIKHKIFMVPQGNQIYWIGSTYDWEYDDDQPSEVQAQKITTKLENILKVPFEIVDHRAAIRPTVKDRRPFIGFHSEYQQLAIFNGLGTKGTTLGPYWAKHFVNVLNGIEELSQSVDIKRFDVQPI